MPQRKGAALTTELDFLCAAIAWPPSSQRDARVRSAAAAVEDWNTVYGLTARHRVAGLVVHALHRTATEIPEPARRAIVADQRRILFQGLATARIAQNVQRAMEKVGIESVMFKGAALAQLAYGQLGIRHAKDIDILVRSEDVARAATVLEDLGFCRSLPPSQCGPRLLSAWRKVRKDFAFRRGAIEIELHWRLTDNPHLLQIPFQSKRWQTVQLARENCVQTLGAEDQFVYLCVHGAANGWQRLKWLADICALLAQEKSGGLRALLSTAQELHAERAVAQAIVLCHRLLKVDIPSDVLADLQALAAVPTLEWLAFGSIVNDGIHERSARTFGTLKGAISRLLLARSFRYKWRELVVNFSNPFEALEYNFPDELMPLYPWVRIFLWLYGQVAKSKIVS